MVLGEGGRVVLQHTRISIGRACVCVCVCVCVCIHTWN